MPVQKIVAGQQIAPAKVERAKELRRCMTPAEKRLWSQLRANRLAGFHFRRQQVIDGFIVDFYCHAASLVVEVDGPAHDTQVEYDAERSRVLAARGMGILRVRNEDVMQDLSGVLARIREALDLSSPPVPLPSPASLLPGKRKSLKRPGSRGGEGEPPATR